MTIDKPNVPNQNCRQAPAQLLHVLECEPPDALISALKTWNWAVNQADESGLTLLFRAVYFGRFDIVDALLNVGANIDCQDNNGWTPLFWATYNQKIDTMRILLARGAQPDLRNIDGEWPLFWAVYRDDWESVSLLLLGGANPLLTDVNGKDVFWLAASLGWEQMQARLLAFRPLG